MAPLDRETLDCLPRVRACAWRLCRNGGADELIAIGSLALVESARDWDASHESKSSLWTYARLAVEGAMRDSISREIHHGHLNLADNRPDEMLLPDKQVQQHQRLQLVRKGLEELPLPERQVLDHIYGEELKQRQVAQVMQMKQQYVSKLHRRALHRIGPDVMVAAA